MTTTEAAVLPQEATESAQPCTEVVDAPSEAQNGAQGEEHSPLVLDLAAGIAMHVFSGGIDGPISAAYRVLGQPQIADALAAVDQLADARHTLDLLRVMHRPVAIREDSPDHVICAATRKHPSSCADCVVLWDITEGGGRGPMSP